MADLEDFTDQGTPLLTDLNAAAPALGQPDQGAGHARGRLAQTPSRASATRSSAAAPR